MIKMFGSYLAPKAVSYGLNFLLIPLLTHLISPADFGVVALAWTVQNALAGICSFGLPGSVSRYYFEYYKDSDKLASLIRSASLILYISFLFWMVLIFMSSKYISLLASGSRRYADAFFWAFIGAYLNQIMGLYLNLFQNMERAFAYGLWMSLQTAMTFVFTLLGVFVFHLSYMGMIWGSLLAALFACAGASWHLHQFDIGRWNSGMAKENVMYGLQIVPKSLSSFVNRFFDKYMLNNILSLNAVGVYNVGQSFINALSGGVTSMQSLFQPRWFKEVFDDPQKASKEVGQMFMLFSYMAAIPMLLVILLAKPLIHAFLPAAYYPLTTVVVVLMLGLAAQLFGMFVGVQYAYAKKVFWIFPITVIGTVLNMLANILLIPKAGILGASWATVISSYGGNLIMVAVGQQVYRIVYPWKWICILHLLLWTAAGAVLMQEILDLRLLAQIGMFSLILSIFITAVFKSGILNQLKEQMS